MSRFLTALIMVIFSMGTPALAAQVSLKEAALLVLDQVEGNGYHAVGDLSVKELRKAFAKITIKELTLPVFLVGSGSRQGAVNLTEKNEIIINPLSFRQYTQRQALLLIIHELLGASGYNDENYEITTRLYLLATSDVSLKGNTFITGYKKGLLRDKNKTFRTDTKNGGTVTGIGGGGDGEVVEFKCSLLDTVLGHADEDPNNTLWLNHYAEMLVEYDSNQKEEYTFKIIDKKQVLVTINRALWTDLSPLDRKIKHYEFMLAYVKTLRGLL